VSRPVTCFRPSRRYLLSAALAILGTAFSVWAALQWDLAWIAAAGFGLSTILVLALALRPEIAIYDTHLQVGRRAILWSDIRRLDQTGWTAPLVVQLTLAEGKRLLVIHPGDVDSCASLLRYLRRGCREALLDGIPYRQFWGEVPAPRAKQLPPPRYPLLRPEDEEEVERMFQRLKAAGRLDEHASDEKSS
jgi:hypothetical protein